MPEHPNDDIAILIVSCDKYSDLWYPSCELLRKFWPDCPYPRFILTNEKDWTHPWVQSLQIGPDRSWSESLQTAINKIPYQYLLLIQDDFLLEAPVNSNRLIDAVNVWRQVGGGYLRLVPFPKVKSPIPINGRSEITEIPHNSPYRISNQASLWEKNLLLDLLIPGETPWQMETAGSLRTLKKGTLFYSTTVPLLKYHPHGAIIRGKWSRPSVNYCQRLGLWEHKRSIQSVPEEIRQHILDFSFNLLINLFPKLLWKITLIRHTSKRNSS